MASVDKTKHSTLRQVGMMAGIVGVFLVLAFFLQFVGTLLSAPETQVVQVKNNYNAPSGVLNFENKPTTTVSQEKVDFQKPAGTTVPKQDVVTFDGKAGKSDDERAAVKFNLTAIALIIALVGVLAAMYFFLNSNSDKESSFTIEKTD